VTESEPARPGEFLSIFCTGLGRLGTASPRETVRRAQAAIGGKPALVTYSGEAPGLPGVNQVNVQVTADAPAGMLPLEIAIGGVASNTVTLLVSEARGGAPSRRARR
ncbi:MAG: hypothetical protein HYR60_00320, partial [Acidobacteria bacterium]|nr:hypothetical protein [Acidobacteriota bacterium]